MCFISYVCPSRTLIRPHAPPPKTAADYSATGDAASGKLLSEVSVIKPPVKILCVFRPPDKRIEIGPAITGIFQR
jgi:hypothetical protein